MNRSILMLGVIVATIGLVAPVSADTTTAAPTKRRVLDSQDDIGCKMVGISALIAAQSRDQGHAAGQATTDVRENFARLDVSTGRSKRAADLVMSSLDATVARVYELKMHSPDTIKHAFPYVCLAQRIATVSEQQQALFFAHALACQFDTSPLPTDRIGVRDADNRLGDCVASHVPDLAGK